MPKMKTNRMASKKFRVTGSGRVKRKRANTSHNTGKKPAKRMRQLRSGKMVDKTNLDSLKTMLSHSTIN